MRREGIELKKGAPYIQSLGRNIVRHWELYLLVLPAVVYFAIFHYAPLYGIQIAFRNYYPGFSITQSEFIGLEHFARFFQSFQSKRIIWNTLRISLMNLVIGFSGTSAAALMLNQVTNLRYKKTVANGELRAVLHLRRRHGRNDHAVFLHQRHVQWACAS